MENILLTLVVVLLVLVLIMLIGLGVLGLKLLRGKNAQAQSDATIAAAPVVVAEDPLTRFHPEVRKRMEEAQFIKRKAQLEATCHLHPQEPSEGSCAICGRYFCASCLKGHGTLTFCREHLNTFLSSGWAEVFTVKSTPEQPEAGVKVVEWKNQIWENEGTPLYVETHYKINVEGDMIESWIVLFAREAEKEVVKKRLRSPDGNAAALN